MISRLLLAGLVVTTAAHAQTRAVVIRNATLVPVTAPRIQQGTIILRNGRIEALGQNIAIPNDATVIDGSGLFVYPGLIDAGTNIGLTEIGSVPGGEDTREIGDLNPSTQVKLLRVLQEREIRRVGSNQVQKVNVRVIASSNRDVEAEVKAGRFRDDLFYRLNAVSISLPPLRERREDIPPLAQAFADRVFSLSPAVKFTSEALELLQRYAWPGNIRELENAVVRAAAMCDGMIQVKDLPERVRNHSANTNGEQVQSGPTAAENWVPLSTVEGEYVGRVLQHTGGNKQAAARVLGVDRKTLDRMIKRHQLDFTRHARR